MKKSTTSRKDAKAQSNAKWNSFNSFADLSGFAAWREAFYMKRFLIIAFGVAILALLPARMCAQGLDQYGGSLDLPCPNGVTNHFYAQEIGNRWWLCDADGNAFWDRSVFSIFYYNEIFPAKYGPGANWSSHKTAQLKSWGWTTVDVDVDASLLPWATNALWPGDHTQPNKMEWTLYTDATNYAVAGGQGVCPGAGLGASKDFGFYDDPVLWKYSSDIKITVNDPFSPCYATWLDQTFNPSTSNPNNGVTTATMTSPWLLGAEPGEGDTMAGFGPDAPLQDGPSGALNTSPGIPTDPTGYNNANLALALLMASPYGGYISVNTAYIEQIDRSIPAKTELANWLQGNGQVSIDVPGSASSSSGTVTLAFSNTQSLPYAAGDTINVTSCSDPNFNGSGLTVASVSGYSITYAEPVSDTASGVNYCVVSLTKAVITGATLGSGAETVTMAVNPYKTGDIVTITGVTPSTFDTASGTGCGVTAYTATTFTCTNGSGSATYTSGGTATSGPGYTLAELNTAWGSNYTTWGTQGVNYTDSISTVGNANACNRTTWVCAGTLAHVPDMYSVWVRDNGAVIAQEGNFGFSTTLLSYGGNVISTYYTMTTMSANAGNVTVTCSTAPAYTVGEQVFVQTSSTDAPPLNAGPYNGNPVTVTAVSGNTFNFTAGSATYSSISLVSTDQTWPATQLSLTTGAYAFTLPGTLWIQASSSTASSGSVTQTIPGATAQPFAASEAIQVSHCQNLSYHGNVNQNPYSTTVSSVSASAPFTVTYPDSTASGAGIGCVIGFAPGANSDAISLDYYSGGWGHGSGFIDENGRNSWVPTDQDSLTGAGTTDAFRNDMNDFVYHFAAAWFGTSRRIFKNYWPNVLFMGADEASGAWCAPARVPVLRAVGQYVDFVNFGSAFCDDSLFQSNVDYAMKYVGNLPIMEWVGIAATGDNSVAPLQPTLPPNQLPANQVARGAEYAKIIGQFLNFEVDAGNGPASGQYPFVGIHLWDGGTDDGGQGNWGMTTYPNDNAYDGRGAIQALGTDQWGYPTGGEKANYGDSIDAITRANWLWLNLIPRQQATGAVGGATQ